MIIDIKVRVCPGCLYPCSYDQFRGPGRRRHQQCRLCRAKRRYAEASNDLRKETSIRSQAFREHAEARTRAEHIAP